MNAALVQERAVLARTATPSKFTPFTLPRRSRKSVLVRADPIDKLKEKAEEFVEETKKNSGLDEGNLTNQAGNKQSPTFGTTDIKTPGGQDAAEVFSPAGAPGGATSLVEITNGRAAMLAMLAAFGAELATREPVFIQIQRAPLAVAATFVTIIVASEACIQTFVYLGFEDPVFQNVILRLLGAYQPFTRDAEIINGRIGMAAFALLIAVETFKAGPGLVF